MAKAKIKNKNTTTKELMSEIKKVLVCLMEKYNKLSSEMKDGVLKTKEDKSMIKLIIWQTR